MKNNLLHRYRDTRLRLHKNLVALALSGAFTGFAQPAQLEEETVPTSGIQIHGELNEDHGEFHLVGSWLPQSEKQKPLPALMSVVAHTDLEFSATGLKQSIQLKGEALQGITTNWVFDLRGNAQIQSVVGENLKSWSVTQGLDGSQQLEIRLNDPPSDLEKDGVWPAKTFVEVLAELDYSDWKLNSEITLEPLEVTSRPGSLFQGVIQARVSDPNLKTTALGEHGVEGLLVPDGSEDSRTPSESRVSKAQWFRILDPDYHLSFQLTALSPEKRQAQFRNYQLAGALTESTARMILVGQFKVDWPQGGTLDLLSGTVAVTDMFLPEGVTLEYQQGTYQLSALAPGAYDIRVEFDVQVTSQSGWSRLEFAGPATELAPIILKGLDASAQFQVKGMTAPEYDPQSASHLTFGPSRGAMTLSWKESEVAEEGRLFYSVEGLSQISIAAGLMRQVHGLEVRVTQGEMKFIQMYLHGDGEVTSVQGPDVLNWVVEPAQEGSLPIINIQLNQPKKDGVDLSVQTQTPLTPFPVKAQPIRLEPIGAIRYGGFLRLYNEGAVKVETRDLGGLSQISPTRFPLQSQSGAIRFGETPPDAQVFAYRFSNADYQLTVQADHIVPELSVSQLLIYHVGENEKAIHVELEVDIREAPLREWEIEIPADYVISQLEAPALADYFVSPKEGQDSRAMLRLVFGSPLQGRRAMSFRLEKNQSDNAASWILPNVIPNDYKSLRGNLGVTADAGYRLSMGSSSGLTDTAVAYFPKRETGLQLAFRIRANDWNANVVIERLAQTIQVDALHMFSLGEGVAYGSSVFHFLISGAPINSLRFKAPEDYGNIEFIAPNLRNWRKTDNGYEIFFHSPVSGPVSVLGNFDRKFSSPEDRLAFTGMETEGAQSEQGYVVVTSDQPFRAVPEVVSDGMISLETNELPEEYRLLVDTSILAAYQYTSRPFTLNLNIVSLPQSPTVNQVVDRAELFSRITSGGQTLTEATLYVKSQGRSHLSIIAPEGFRLWTVEVDGRSVTPAVGTRSGENLAPLPQNADPDQVIQVQLQMGSDNADPSAQITKLQAPALDAPLLYAEWKVETEAGQGLRFVNGPIQPLEKGERSNGLAVLEKLFTSNAINFKATSLVLGLALLFMGGLFWKWTLQSCRYQWTFGYSLGFIMGSLSLGIGFAITLVHLPNLAGSEFKLPSELNFVAPFQEKSTNLSLELERVSDSQFRTEGLLAAWPALIGLALLLVPTLESFKDVCRPHRTMMNSFAMTLIGWGCLNFEDGALIVVAGLMLGMAYYWIRYLGSALMSLPSKPRPPKPPTPPTPPTTPEPTHPKTQESTMTPSASPTGSASLWIFAMILAIGQFSPGNLYGQSQQAQMAQQTQPQLQAEYSQQAMIPAKDVAPYAQSIYETWTIQDQNAQARAEILWQAKAGDKLPFGADQAVTRSIRIEPESSAEIRRLDVVLARPAGNGEFFVVAKESGLIQIVWEYTPKLETNGDLIQATIPTPMSLSHQIEVTWTGLEWETICPRAISIRSARDEDKKQLLANLTLAPSQGSWIGWRPRGRDTKAEQSVFYVDLYHLFTPASGALEGFHYASIRPAQGQVKQLEFQVDEALTITNVRAPRLQTWRFDPDQNLLRIQLEEGQSQSFNVIIESQISAGSLPYERKLGLLSSTQAANQVGMVGIATRPEAQLDSVEVEGLAQINLEDFPQEITASAQTADPLTLRRAYRTSSDSPSITLKVSAVQPDIRVVSEENLSLGEDRVLLSSQLTVDITRTGVFQLSFNLPEGMDVESISGSALSHWAQSQSDGDAAGADLSKQVTLYLRERTEGRQTFSIQLVGPGIQPQSGWSAPKLVLNEASKSQGRITLAPEQGLRLHLIEREAVTLMESNSPTQRPAARNSLAFQILNTRWKLGFDIEQVPAWIQVNTLQEVTFKEGVEQSVTYYDYNVENAGVKSLKIQVPSDAESVRVEGDSITDAVRVSPATEAEDSGSTPQIWEVKLGKRILGPYSFSVRHQRPMQDQPSSNTLKGAPAVGVDLQRGYLALRSTGRVQLNVPEETVGLQALSDWQTLPAGLRSKSGESAPNYVYRVMDPNYALDFNWTRYTAAKMDQAKIESMTLSSILSEGEAILTHVRMEILPGDLRALEIQLPESSDFWFAFVNQQSVAPWSVNTTILTPLEPSAIEGEATVVEFLYTTPNPYGSGFKSWRNISAPKFGLPLENITWNVYSPNSWKLTHWGSNFQHIPELEDTESPTSSSTSSWRGSYLETENNRQQQKVMEANEFFNLGNTLLEKGQNKDAMRAYEAALNMSNNDVAFNEDARVQLDNVKMLNYASGLNQRFQNVYGQEMAQNQIASEVMADESVMNALARRLVEQQEAAAILPRAIRASLPEIGDKLVFERALQADSDAALKLQIRFETPSAVVESWGWKLGAALALFVIIGLTRKLAKSPVGVEL